MVSEVNGGKRIYHAICSQEKGSGHTNSLQAVAES